MSAAQDGNLHGRPFPQFSGAPDPLAVAMLYNRNGMATWCWEAAHALHELGRSAILIAAADAPLPGSQEVEVVRINEADKPVGQHYEIAKALSAARSRLSAGPDAVLRGIHMGLAARGVSPVAYVLNQSTLVDRSVPCTHPQNRC